LTAIRRLDPDGCLRPLERNPKDADIRLPQRPIPSKVHQLHSHFRTRLAVVSDEPEKFGPGSFPAGTAIHHRAALDEVQRQFAEIPGTTVLIYDQT